MEPAPLSGSQIDQQGTFLMGNDPEKVCDQRFGTIVALPQRFSLTMRNMSHLTEEGRKGRRLVRHMRRSHEKHHYSQRLGLRNLGVDSRVE